MGDDLTLEGLAQVLSMASKRIKDQTNDINRAHAILDLIGVKHTDEEGERADLGVRMDALRLFIERERAHLKLGTASPTHHCIDLQGNLHREPRPAGPPCTAVEDGVLCEGPCVTCNARKIGRAAGCTCGLVPHTWQNPEYHSTGCPMVRGGPLDPERQARAAERLRGPDPEGS